MKWLDADIGSPNGSLQEAPKVFEAVGVNSSPHIGDGMVNNFVSILRGESFIGAECVSVDCRPFLNVSFDVRDKCLPFGARNDFGSDFPATLQKSEDRGFVLVASAGDFGATFREVHVARLSPDESFINFDFPAQLSERTILQGKPNPMHHKPSGLLSDPEVTRHFIGTDSVFAIAQHPNCGKPLIEADGRVLEDGPDLDRELPLGMVTPTLPDAAARIEVDLGGATGRADNAFRPAPCHKVFEAVVGIREVQDCFLKTFRFLFHGVPHKQNCTINWWMCQVYSCPI